MGLWQATMVRWWRRTVTHPPVWQTRCWQPMFCCTFSLGSRSFSECTSGAALRIATFWEARRRHHGAVVVQHFLIFSPEIHFLGLCVRRKWSTLLSLWKNKQQRCCQDPQGPGGCSCPVLSPCSRLQFCEHILNQSEPTVRFTVGLPYFLPRAPTVTHPRGCVTVGRHHRTMVACHKPTGAPLGPEIPL